MWATVVVHVQSIMYTTQGHCVGGEPHYIRCECREFALSVLCKWPHTTGLVIVPVEVVDV